MNIELRDYFAAKVLPSLVDEFMSGMRAGEHGYDEQWRHYIALDAYRMADAMLDVRNAKVSLAEKAREKCGPKPTAPPPPPKR